YCVLRLHCSTTSGGAEAWRKRRAPLSRSARIVCTIAGLSSSSASTASEGWTRSRSAAASAGGSARICVASAEPPRGTASLGFSTIWLTAHLPVFSILTPYGTRQYVFSAYRRRRCQMVEAGPAWLSV